MLNTGAWELQDGGPTADVIRRQQEIHSVAYYELCRQVGCPQSTKEELRQTTLISQPSVRRRANVVLEAANKELVVAATKAQNGSYMNHHPWCPCPPVAAAKPSVWSSSSSSMKACYFSQEFKMWSAQGQRGTGGCQQGAGGGGQQSTERDVDHPSPLMPLSPSLCGLRS